MLRNGLMAAAGVAEEEEEEEEEEVSGMERLKTASLDKNCGKVSKMANKYHRYHRRRNHHHECTSAKTAINNITCMANSRKPTQLQTQNTTTTAMPATCEVG